MTKPELKTYLKTGGLMVDAFEYCSGQECEIFKADEFKSGDEIIYIPDPFLNRIPLDTPVIGDEAIEEVIDCCCTGDDFIWICGGNAELAERLFWFCDWQHPSSAYDEGIFEEDED